MVRLRPEPSLGDRVGRHSKGDSAGLKAERPNIRLVRKSQFDVLPSMEDVVGSLFGG